MGGKVKEFQKMITDDADFKDTISGDHVCESLVCFCASTGHMPGHHTGRIGHAHSGVPLEAAGYAPAEFASCAVDPSALVIVALGPCALPKCLD